MILEMYPELYLPFMFFLYIMAGIFIIAIETTAALIVESLDEEEI